MNNLIGTTAINLGVFGPGLYEFNYWIGIRTPVAGSGLQGRLEVTDTLGFLTTNTTGLVDGSDFGSLQGSFCMQGDGTTESTWTIDSLGTAGLEYDVMWTSRFVS